MDNELSPLVKQQVNDASVVENKNNSKNRWRYIIVATLVLTLIGLATWVVLRANNNTQPTSQLSGSSLSLIEAEAEAEGETQVQTDIQAETDSTQPPNIIFVVIDDIGWGDISLHGAEFPTPVLDNLVSKDSIFFDSHYGLLCTPSRTQFLSGRYAFNLGVANLEPFEYLSIGVVPHQIPLISDVLKKHTDYETYLIGKWHLGYATEDALPNNRGFDYFYGFHGGEVDYYEKTSMAYSDQNEYYDWFENEDVDEDGKNGFSTIQCSAKLTQKLKEIDAKQNKDPFYMYVGVQSPHIPLTYSPDPITQAQCEHIDNDEQRNYFCQNVIEIDHLMGNLIRDLKESNSNLWDNTIVVFTSDNGGDYPYGGCNYPYRGSKGQYYEGGIRTLAFVTGGYDAVEAQYGEIRSTIFHGVDWTPTFLSLAMNSETYKEVLNSYEFDGHDQSKFILFGDEYNVRDDAPIMVRSDTEDDNVIIFTYDNTRYKYITTQDELRASSAYCIYDKDTNERGSTLLEYLGSEMLFNLDEDPYEHTNILGSQSDDKTIQNAYHYVLDKLATYRTNKYFNDYPDCFTDQSLDEALPSNTDGAYKAFLTNEQWNQFFDEMCGDQVNDNLKQLFYATVEVTVEQ